MTKCFETPTKKGSFFSISKWDRRRGNVDDCEREERVGRGMGKGGKRKVSTIKMDTQVYI